MAMTFDVPLMSTSVASSQVISGLSSPLHTTFNMGATSESSAKRHAACDECRGRKLKCSGQASGCNRCVKQGIVCNYSEQKQMGRPRKRRKTDTESVQQQTPPTPTNNIPDVVGYQNIPPAGSLFAEPQGTNYQPDLPIDPSLAAQQRDEARFSNICRGPIAQTIRDRAGTDTFRQQISQYAELNSEQLSGPGSFDTLQAQYPLDIAQWPDYSTLESLPAPLQPDTIDPYFLPSPYPPSAEVSNALYDPDADRASLSALPTSPSCSCLANLYLTLSTLSTLSAFPITNHTIETLLAAHRTAHGVIYCPVCPRKFQTGSQNLMLGCTLLNVLADNWHKVKRASSDDLKKGFTKRSPHSEHSPEQNSGFMSTKEGQTWRKFARQLVRAYVFGDEAIPTPPTQLTTILPASESITPQRSPDHDPQDVPDKTRVPPEHTLLFVIKALQRRQRQWHNFDELTDEFPDRCNEGYSYHHHHHDPHAHRVNKITKHPEPDSAFEQGKELSEGPEHCRVHGKPHEHARPQSNGTSNTEPKGSIKKHNSDTSQVDPDHALCLMIVKYSLDIVRSLDED